MDNSHQVRYDQLSGIIAYHGSRVGIPRGKRRVPNLPYNLGKRNLVDQTEQFLQALTEAHGVPGYETEVRGVLRGYMAPLGDMTQDKLGSLICRQAGEGPRLMLVGHMDEIGLIVTYIDDNGFLKFLQLGGWWDQTILSQRVIVKTHQGDVVGVVGAKPPHMLSGDERNKMVEKKDMYIDIGATSKAETEAAGVRVGDPVVPDSRFAVMALSLIHI